MVRRRIACSGGLRRDIYLFGSRQRRIGYRASSEFESVWAPMAGWWVHWARRQPDVFRDVRRRVSGVPLGVPGRKIGPNREPPHPARGGTKVRKPFTRVITPPAIIFASWFALNGSSRHTRIMAMGISIKTAGPIRPIGGEARMNFASQQYRTGQQRPHTGSSIKRRSTIETTAPLCHAYQPRTE